MFGVPMMKMPPRRPSICSVGNQGEHHDDDHFEGCSPGYTPGGRRISKSSLASTPSGMGSVATDGSIADINTALDNGATMFNTNSKSPQALASNGHYLAKAFTFKAICPTGVSPTKGAGDEFRQGWVETLSAGNNSRMSTKASRRKSSKQSVTDADLKRLFLDEGGRFTPQHTRLPQTVELVFGFLRPENKAAEEARSSLLYPGISTKTIELTKHHFNKALYRCKRVARKIINQPVFTFFMLLLTFYALFGPDLVTAYGRQPVDHTFMIFNTCAFFIFGIEVVLMLLGRQDYLIIPFILDIAAMLSLLSDTWFLQMGSDGQVQDRLNVARSSRVTRLTRVVRIARVTRLVPFLMKLLGRNTMKFAQTLLERKLWRICIFLDTDADGCLSMFDLKCFYLVVLQELRDFGDLHCKQMFQSDTELLNTFCNAQDECVNNLRYDTFVEIFLSTEAGQKVLELLSLDIEQDSGVWTLTNRISDSIGLKICVGIVLLFLTLELLAPNIKDKSSEQVLAQMDQFAKYVNAQGLSNGYDDVCTQVQKYMSNFKVLFLYLDGRTVVDGGGCVAQGLNISQAPLDYVSTVMKNHDLRSSEVFQLCIPFVEMCEVGQATSISLIDNRSSATENAQWTIVQTFILIALLLIFVVYFNHYLSGFTKSLVHPLRIMVDDMLSASSLEMLQVDAETLERSMPQYKRKRVVDELQHLESAYKRMNQAVKAWSLYVPPAVVQCLLHAGMEATIGMTRVDCTVLFCDIANFDEVCGNLCAHDVLRKLSEVLGKIADVIEANNGTLLEFIGDEVMAVFNAPNSMRLHPKVGVQAGVQIHEAIEMIAPQKSSDGKEIVVKCQVGVHSARILAGNVGSPQRMKYGLLGDGVNLSARLKGLNSKYGTKTLVTHQVLEEIQQFEDFNQAFVSRPIDVVAVKGRKEPTTVHEVFCSLRRDKDTADLEMLVASHEEAFRLYHQRLFKDALKVFSEVTKGFEQGGYGRDEPSRQLAGRCHTYIAQPPPNDWDGVERLKSKHFQVPQEPLHEDAKPEVLKDNGDDNVRPMTTYTSDSVKAEASITLIQPNFSPPAPHLSEALVYKSFEEIEELDLAKVEADS